MIVQVILFLAAAATFEESYRAGLQALQQNRLAEARTNLEEAAHLVQANPRVWIALAQTYWKLHETRKANEAAEKAGRLGSGDAVVLKLLAVFYSEAEQWIKAGDTLADYAAQVPNDREAITRAMGFYLQAHTPERAISLGIRSAEWEQRAEVRDLLGKAYSAANQPDLSDREFRAAVRLNPVEESYAFDFANSLLQRQEFEPAIQVLQQAKRNFDKSAQIELALGVAYYGLRRYAEAGTAFERTIALSPDLDQPYLFLGRMLDQIPAKVRELTRVFEAFEKAHPQNYAGYFLHAKALVAQSLDADLAERLLKKACSLNTRVADPFFELGVLLQKERRFAEAAAQFELAASLAPRDAAVHYRLAQVYDRLGKPEAAAAERKRHAQLMEAGPQ